MLERARQILVRQLRRVAGEVPGGVTYPVVCAVERGDISLKAANSLVRFVEVMYEKPPYSSQKIYEDAVNKIADADRPKTPRGDSLLY